MNLKPFKLEEYFDKYEFTVKYLLSSSDSERLTMQEVLNLADKDELDLWNNLSLGYTESKGLPTLRKVIAKLYNNISTDNVLVMAPEEGVFISMNAILGKGDHVICTFPGYQSLYEIAEGINCEVTKWLPEEKNEWRFNPEFLLEAIRPNTKLIVFNFPHNPTGFVPSHEDFKKIIEIARKHNIWIFSDEMYKFLEFREEDRLPSASDIYEKAISLCGMSKSFGMPGIRIGWISTQDTALYNKIASFKHYTTICNGASGEILALIGLKHKAEILDRQFQIINKNIEIVEKFFKSHADLFSWVKPKAGTICFPKLLFTDDAFEFCDTLVNKTGIMLLPSTVYDFDNTHIRLAFGRKNFPETLGLFEDYLKSIKR